MPVLRLQWPPVSESGLTSWQPLFPPVWGEATGRIAAVTRVCPGAGFRLQGAVFVLQPRDFHSVLQMVLEEVPEPVR